MARNRTDKKKADRKAKQKKRREKIAHSNQQDKAAYLFYEALTLWDYGHLQKALNHLEKAVRLDPKNEEFLKEWARLGHEMNRPDIELKALLGLYRYGFLTLETKCILCDLLMNAEKYEEALPVIQETIPLVSKSRNPKKKELRSYLRRAEAFCQTWLESRPEHALTTSPESSKPDVSQEEFPDTLEESASPPAQEDHKDKAPIPEIRVSLEVDSVRLRETLKSGRLSTREDYELTLDGYRVRFRETFENLICLNSLKDVRSFWYQEETARKVLKVFRGRALLADEVGLGKTIEALMILKEYIQRGMVKSALILAPSPLVSQWKEELAAKFDLRFASTEDLDRRAGAMPLWDEPFILASINIAKSKKNFRTVTEREYDMVIVDEAHHLKNRNTLNWKLVNSLKKRFLLLLTATPVENNLIELYNLVTLLKPGQLKTASAFRREFMTRGDPTDPRNRSQLKELLGQVMIRNTRALAKIDIPPRYAQTIRVETRKLEKEFYERISTLVGDINAANGTRHRLLLKNLLEQAGSSPQAVSLSLSRVLEKRETLPEHQQEMWAINNMCQSLSDSSKNEMLLKLMTHYHGKMIVFVKYLGTLDHVSAFLAWHKIPHALFHGRMNSRAKDEQVENFRENVDILLTTEIGGEGRNLQFCHQMVNYDLPWNPMKIEQRIGRIHRIGQKKEVTVHNLCAAGSVEDHILKILDKKINMFEMVIGEIDMVVGRISGEQDFSEIVYDIWVNSAAGEDREKDFDRLASRLKRAKTGYEKSKTLDEKLFGENYEL